MWDRPDLEVAVVHPIEVADPNNPEIPEDLRGEGTLLLLIQPEPKSYVSDDEERDAIIAQMNFRKSVDCEL